MKNSGSISLRERVERAAEAALKHNGSVGPLELLLFMGFLPGSHMEMWRKGHEAFPNLEQLFQVGPEKLSKSLHHFQEWIRQRGLRPVEASYALRTASGTQELQVTTNGDPEWERFYRTHFIPGDLTENKAARLNEKLKRPPELVVFQKVSEEGNCSDCGVDLGEGSLLLMEKGKPLCLTCADLDQLEFLPAGDMALTRRARKYSTLAAVVVRFNRRRKRYERQGLLVAGDAVARAEQECAADAPERAAARARAAVARQEEDREFMAALTEKIALQYPGCPAAEARRIAEHTGMRSSGRVGRSAAGRDLDPVAVDLAVIAHIRHEHTNYDELLMRGTDRLEARAMIREKIDQVLAKWRS